MEPLLNPFRISEAKQCFKPTSQVTTYSTFIIESVIQDCFTLLYIMASLLKLNIELEVDFLESTSDWKFESI